MSPSHVYMVGIRPLPAKAVLAILRVDKVDEVMRIESADLEYFVWCMMAFDDPDGTTGMERMNNLKNALIGSVPCRQLLHVYA